MTDSLVRQQVDSMRLTLQAVEMQLGSGSLHPGSLSTRHPAAMMLRDSASLLGRRINEARDRAG